MYLTSESDIERIVRNVVNGLSKQEQPKSPQLNEKLYTTEEACEFLRCSKPTLHRWKKEGIVPFVRIGVNIRYRESDLRNLINKKGA